MSLTEIKRMTFLADFQSSTYLEEIGRKSQDSKDYIAARYRDGSLDFYLPTADQLPYGVNVFESDPSGTVRSYKVGRLGKRTGLFVLASIVTHEDQAWYHVSFSKPDKTPSYQDMAWVKDIWIGPDRSAFQLFPKKEEHVNIHEKCLHLWCCLDDFHIPDFRTFGNI